MLQNITLSAKKDLIERARQRAQARHTTLNSEFRRWLALYVQVAEVETDLAGLMDRFNYAQPAGTFRREEMNER
jgi:hypothetical protein